MTELYNDVAMVLYPLIAGGAGAATNEIAKQTGSKVLESVLGRLRVRRPILSSQTELAETLEDAVADGAVSIGELERLLSDARTLSTVTSNVTNNVGEIGASNSVIGSTISGSVHFGSGN